MGRKRARGQNSSLTFPCVQRPVGEGAPPPPFSQGGGAGGLSAWEVGWGAEGGGPEPEVSDRRRVTVARPPLWPGGWCWGGPGPGRAGLLSVRALSPGASAWLRFSAALGRAPPTAWAAGSPKTRGTRSTSCPAAPPAAEVTFLADCPSLLDSPSASDKQLWSCPQGRGGGRGAPPDSPLPPSLHYYASFTHMDPQLTLMLPLRSRTDVQIP